MSVLNKETILKYWFGEDLSLLKNSNYKHRAEIWFKISWQTDEYLKENFLEFLKKAENGELDDWNYDIQGSLALIIIFDQFSRNIYRGSADMFKNDSKALQISLNLIDSNLEFKNFSLIEKFFTYLPLLHTEDVKTAQRSLDLIHELYKESPVEQKNQFEKYYTSSNTHLGLLLKYNRYPHRNSLLNRESTREELEFLQRSKHNFVKSVQPLSKPPAHAFQLINSSQSTSKPKPSKQNSQLPFQNILFLHGFRQNSNKLKKRVNKLIRTLKLECNAHIKFLNGTHPYIPKGEIASQMSSTLGQDTLNPIESQRVWFNSDDSAEVYYGLEQSIDHVLSEAKIHGPFDGIIGFGQGAVLASIVVKNHPLLFRYLINISAFEPRSLKHKNLFSPEQPFDFASMHIYGKNDNLITPSRSEKFSKCFKQPFIAEHTAGHFAPDAWPIEKIVEFISFQAKNLSPTKFPSNLSLPLSILKLNDALLRFSLDQLDLEPLFRNTWSKEYLKSDEFKNLNFPVNFEIISGLDDLFDKLLLIYLQLIKSKNSENTLQSILKPVLNIYLKNENFSDYFLKEILDILFLNNWKALVCLGDLSYAEKENSKALVLYENLVKKFCNQLVKDLVYIDAKNGSYNLQELTSLAKEQDELSLIKLSNIQNDDEPYHISDLAKHLPRIKSAVDKRCRLGRECAEILNPYKQLESGDSDKYERRKIFSYNHYRKVLSVINHYESLLQTKLENSNPRKYFNLAKHDKKVMEYLMQAPLSDAILNPVPEPVDVSSYEQMKPLYEWLEKNKLEEVFDQEDLKFLRGTITTDGRLDLCKQVIGPQGIKPLLDSLSENKHINRLLLGNNVVGDEAGKQIAAFIKSGKSPLTIWYIAGNNLTVKGITPICEALLEDNQVNALWLKRNPLKAAGMVPIGKLIEFNKNIQVLDLLNCGLLDEGVKILFESLEKNNTLKHLYLSANGVTSVGLERIKDYYKKGLSSLETLFLGANRIGNQGAKIVSEILELDTKLVRLNLGSSRIGAEGMKYLSEPLKVHPSLKVLDMGYIKATMDLGELGNYIEDEGAFYLSKVLEKSDKIMWINITHNMITQKGLQVIVDKIKDMNRTLLYFDYVQYGTSLNEITLTDLRNSLQRNRDELLQRQPDFNPDSIFVPDHVREIYSVYRTH